MIPIRRPAARSVLHRKPEHFLPFQHNPLPLNMYWTGGRVLVEIQAGGVNIEARVAPKRLER
jgi:hypothetical protein